MKLFPENLNPPSTNTKVSGSSDSSVPSSVALYSFFFKKKKKRERKRKRKKKKMETLFGVITLYKMLYQVASGALSHEIEREEFESSSIVG